MHHDVVQARLGIREHGDIQPLLGAGASSEEVWIRVALDHLADGCCRSKCRPRLHRGSNKLGRLFVRPFDRSLPGGRTHRAATQDAHDHTERIELQLLLSLAPSVSSAHERCPTAPVTGVVPDCTAGVGQYSVDNPTMGRRVCGSHTVAPGRLRSACATSRRKVIGIEVSPVGISKAGTSDHGPLAATVLNEAPVGTGRCVHPVPHKRISAADRPERSRPLH